MNLIAFPAFGSVITGALTLLGVEWQTLHLGL